MIIHNCATGSRLLALIIDILLEDVSRAKDIHHGLRLAIHKQTRHAAERFEVMIAIIVDCTEVCYRD
jgi:hypothetical protein